MSVRPFWNLKPGERPSVEELERAEALKGGLVENDEAARGLLGASLGTNGKKKDEPVEVKVVDREEAKKARRVIGVALEVAVQRGKIKPFEALEAAAMFGVHLCSSIQAAHDYYLRSRPVEAEAE